MDIKCCVRGIKNGVAECEIAEILGILEPFYLKNPNYSSNITESDLYRLGIIGNKKERTRVSKKLNLGKCNAKLFYKRLIYNNITLEKLEEAIK